MLQIDPSILGMPFTVTLVAGQVVALDFTALGKTPSGCRVQSGVTPCVATITGPGRGVLTDVMGTASGTFTLWVW